MRATGLVKYFKILFCEQFIEIKIMKLVIIILLSILLIFLWPGFAEAEQGAGEITTMSTAWGEIAITQEKCLTKAEIAMRNGGFSKGLEVVGNSSVFADRGAYIGSIRCIASEKIVFFVVAGPSGDRVDRYKNEIENNFAYLLM